MNEAAAITRIQHLMAMKRLTEADKLACEALSTNPDSSHLHAMRSICLRHTDRLKESLQEARKAVGLDDSNTFAWYAMSASLFDSGQYAKARTAAENGMVLDETDADFPYLHGMANVKLDRLEQAGKDLEHALRLDPGHARAASVLAMVEQDLGRYKRADQLSRQAAAADPNSSLAHVSRSKALWAQGQRAEAIAAAKEAMRVNPDNDVAQNQLKQVLQENSLAYRLAFRGAEVVGAASEHSRWSIVLVILFASRVARIATRINPDLIWIIGPAAALYALFWVFQWEVRAISCFILMMHPLGRPLLMRREKWAAFALAAGFPIGVALMTTGFALAVPAATIAGALTILSSLVAAPILAR